MRDRYLFSADRKVTEYRDVLEITRGRARLLTPSASARMLRWFMAIGVFVVYYGIGTFGLVVLTLGLGGFVAALPGWAVVIAFGVFWFGGLFVVFLWWDRRTLPLLAENPAEAIELILMGARSFGTYQDVRARTMRGEELHLVVDTRAPHFWEAVRLLEGKTTTFG